MLAGHAPFAGDNPITVAYKQQHEVPPPPSAANPAVSPQLDGLVAWTMSLDPAARPQTADELRTALLTVADAPIGGAAAAEATVAFPVQPTAVFAPPPVAAAAATRPSGSGGGGGRVEPAEGAAAAGAGSAAAIAAGRRASGRPPAPPPIAARHSTQETYRRRRLVVAGVLVVLVLGAVAAVALLGNHGTSTSQATVPPVVGLPVADATAKVGQAGFKPVVGPENLPGVPDHVVDQRPAGGVKANRNTEVSLFVPATTTTITTTPRSTTRPTIRATTTTVPATTTTAGTTTTIPVVTTRPATTAVPTTGSPPST
jgi:serine/threonine-protein kinase